jgi:hypothetical protein
MESAKTGLTLSLFTLKDPWTRRLSYKQLHVPMGAPRLGLAMGEIASVISFIGVYRTCCRDLRRDEVLRAGVRALGTYWGMRLVVALAILAAVIAVLLGGLSPLRTGARFVAKRQCSSRFLQGFAPSEELNMLDVWLFLAGPLLNHQT